MLRKKKKQNVRPSSTEGKKRILYLIRDRNGMEKHRRKQAVLFAGWGSTRLTFLVRKRYNKHACRIQERT